jgi:hypothetical protein
MTRLTNALKRTIIDAVLEDLPKTDFSETARKRALELAVAHLPPEAQRIWKDGARRGLLKTSSLYVWGKDDRGVVVSVSLPGFETYHDEIKKDPQFAAACAAVQEQKKTFDELKLKLKGQLNACPNVKTFCERFPDLACYVPESEAEPVNLPATTDLIDNLKAAGLKLPRPLKKAA